MKLRNLQRIIKSTGQRYLLSMNEAVSALKKILLRERSKGWWWTRNVQGHIRDIPATISRNRPEKDTYPCGGMMNDNASQFSKSDNKLLLYLHFRRGDKGTDTSWQNQPGWSFLFTNLQGNHENHIPDETRLCHQDELAGEPKGKTTLH